MAFIDGLQKVREFSGGFVDHGPVVLWSGSCDEGL